MADRVFLVAMTGLILALPGMAQTSAHERGRLIFEKGRTHSGRVIQARLGTEGHAVPATAMTCAGCHGEDGRGRSEGGLVPSDITWESLTRPYTVINQDGRRRPPYTEPLFKRAVMTGVDSAGQPLHPAMPRFEFTVAEAEDLLHFIKGLSTHDQPGLDPGHVRIGVLLAPPSLATAWNQPIREAMNRYVRHLNQQGGFFGRMLDIVFFEPSADAAGRPKELREFLANTQPFVLCAGYVDGLQEELVPLLRAQGIPLIGAHASWHPRDRDQTAEIFYLYPSSLDLAQRLLDEAFNEKPIVGVVIARQYGRLARALLTQQPYVDRVRADQLRLWIVDDVRATVAEITRSPIQHLVVLGLGQEGSIDFFGELATARPDLAVSGLGPHLGKGFGGTAGRFRQASLIWPRGLQPNRVSTELGFQDAPGFVHLFALAAMEITAKALANVGREPTRSRVIRYLETLFEYPSQFAPPLTFGANRRVGALEGYLQRFQSPAERLPSRQVRTVTPPAFQERSTQH